MPIFDYKSKLPPGLNQSNIDEEQVNSFAALGTLGKLAVGGALIRAGIGTPSGPSASELGDMASRSPSPGIGGALAVAAEKARFEDVKEEVRLRMQRASGPNRRKAQSILASPDAFGSSASATLSKRFQLG